MIAGAVCIASAYATPLFLIEQFRSAAWYETQCFVDNPVPAHYNPFRIDAYNPAA